MYLNTILSFSDVEEASHTIPIQTFSEKNTLFLHPGPEYWEANIYNELTAEYLVWVQQT